MHRLANLITAGSHFAGGQGTQKPARAGGSVLGTSTRTSDVLINLGLNPLRWCPTTSPKQLIEHVTLSSGTRAPLNVSPKQLIEHVTLSSGTRAPHLDSKMLRPRSKKLLASSYTQCLKWLDVPRTSKMYAHCGSLGTLLLFVTRK